ncbi:uncharacterized protein [Anoplolepis gracilipes]|uniref:uncharacterized protein n=1 Tax=Anoplolepis gracilipes TaxID=354296 RepID=UPI003B9DF685
MKRVIISGFICAMSECNENSGINHQHLSFFRFPPNPERAKLWLQACGIKKDISPKKLYNNYRVCSKHFASHMFLNDLRNRLQLHAIPNVIINITNEEATTQNEINIETSTDNKSTKNIEANVVAMSSTTDNLTDILFLFLILNIDVSTNSTENINPSNNDHQTSKNDKVTQTELKLSNSTPRKIALRRKCDAAEKRAKRAILKYNKEEKSIDDITFNDFQKLLYKFYLKPIADFMKDQADNLNAGNCPSEIIELIAEATEKLKT